MAEVSYLEVKACRYLLWSTGGGIDWNIDPNLQICVMLGNGGRDVVQIEIVSYGPKNCSANNPAVYTRVSAYRSCILDTLAQGQLPFRIDNYKANYVLGQQCGIQNPNGRAANGNNQPGRPPNQNPSQNPGQDSGRFPGQNPGKQPGQNPGRPSRPGNPDYNGAPDYPPGGGNPDYN
ncbi:hypothetical protein B4U80_14293, partial [Leptotrombidium deliense]